MSNQTSSGGTPNRLKQDQILFLILLMVLAALFLGFIFTSYKPNETKSPEKDVSLAQALTLVAEASQTARAANPGFSTSQATRVVSTATRVATNTLSPQTNSLLTSTSAVSSSGSRSTTGQTSSQATPTFPINNVTIRATYTPKPTETSRPADPPTPTLTATSTASPGLPGITMSAVVARLTEKGFNCALASSETGPILWMCDLQIGYDIWYHVDIYGNSKIEVTNLLVTVFQTFPVEAKSIEILSYMASLPYTSAIPSQASTWVADTLSDIQSVEDVREKFIGSVRFKLYGGPQGRYLEMGDPVQQ